MTAFAALVLNDNAAVATTFGPAGIDSSGVAKWMGNQAVFDGKKTVTMSVTHPKSTGSVVRIKQKVTIPILDAQNAKVGESSVNVEFVISKLASNTDRLDLRAFGQNLLANAVTTAAVTNFESIY